MTDEALNAKVAEILGDPPPGKWVGDCLDCEWHSAFEDEEEPALNALRNHHRDAVIHYSGRTYIIGAKPYATDHNHAAIAREWAHGEGWHFNIWDKRGGDDEGFVLDAWPHDRSRDVIVTGADTEPRAICLAVLKIAEIENGDRPGAVRQGA